MAGTAPAATAWLVLEQPGPWGAAALTESDLDPELGAFLTAVTGEFGVRVLLVRHPDRPQRDHDGRSNVWVARVASGNPQLRHAVLDDVSEIADWDFAAMAIGYLPEVGEITTDPLLLICAHGRRDACCAVSGRALLSAVYETATAAERSRIWESSHIAGHRFAPVSLALPYGAVHGRVSVEEADAFLAASMHGEVLPHRFRGRTCYPAPFQAAGAVVRQSLGTSSAGDLDVLRVVGGHAVPAHPTAALFDEEVTAEVRHADGRAWRVRLREVPVERVESCGAAPVSASSWEVIDLVQSRS